MIRPGIRRLFRLPLRGRAVAERELDDEIRLHLELRVEDLVRRGLSPEEARAEALRRFGPLDESRRALLQAVRRRETRMRILDWLDGLRQDVRYGVRQVARNPGFAAAAILSLALGIGANTAIFSVVEAVLLRPLPYRDADRVVTTRLSLPDYHDVRERSRSYDRTAVYATNLYKLATGDEPEEVMGAVVSPDFFRVLGDPLVGRAPRPDEARTPVAVISHALWRRRFADDPGVVGETILLNGDPFTVIGVMPPAFQFPERESDVWVPLELAMAAAPEQATNRALPIFVMVARMAPGVAYEAAQREVRAIGEGLAREYPETNGGRIPELMTLHERVIGQVRTPLLVLLGAVGLVLLIACANVANLLLTRAAARSREIAARAALGAERGRLARQLLTESGVIAAVAAAVGVGLAAVALAALRRLAVDLPRLAEVELNGRVLLFTAAAAALTVLLFGLAPVLQATRTSPAALLREGGRGSSGGRGTRSLRAGLVVAEVALSLAILVGAGLLVQSLARMLNQEQGFEPRGLLAANLALFEFEEPARRAVMLDQVLRGVAGLPGVESVAAGTGLPARTPQRGTGFEIRGRAPDPANPAGAYFLAVSPGYFRSLGTTVLRGRDFGAADGPSGAPVALVNETMARLLFPGEDPIGRELRLVNPEQEPVWRTIVGVVPDVRYRGLDNASDPAIYTPFAQTPFPWAYLMVRARSRPEALAKGIREAVTAVDPRLTPARVEPMEAVVSEAVAQRRFHTTLVSGFALLALVLAAVGIYGVVSYSVAQRTREIGVRIALGASPAGVVRGVVRQGLLMVLAGVVLGVAATLWLTRFIASMLYGVSATDPATLAGVAVLLAAVAAVASWIPARRAARVDPVVALRSD